MTAIDPTTEQTARLPTDYIGGTCEGRRASPSNPNQTREEHVKEGLSETVIFRCTVAEKAALVAKADAAGLPNATLMREALGLVQARRRKPVPRVDPSLRLPLPVSAATSTNWRAGSTGRQMLAAQATSTRSRSACGLSHLNASLRRSLANTARASNDHLVLFIRHGRRCGPR